MVALRQLAARTRRRPACRRPTGRRPAQDEGFTLLELMIVMVIIGILAAIAIPSFVANVKRAKEAVLREDLHTLRSAIDSYTYDKQKAPQSLDDLVTGGYLKVDPGRPLHPALDTWLPDQSDTLSTVDETDSRHRRRPLRRPADLGTDGTTYNTW